MSSPSSVPTESSMSSVDSVSGFVDLYALSAGHFTLPEEQFVSGATSAERKTVPSLSFLIQHTCQITEKTTRIVFDLGLRRDLDRYAAPIRKHVETRQPMTTDPDVTKSLARGGLTPDDIDYVVYSHVHWDHVGEPRDFRTSTFVVGYGSLDLLSGRAQRSRGGHSFFEEDLLDLSRTVELPSPEKSGVNGCSDSQAIPVSSKHAISLNGPWQPLGDFPAAIDLFQDGSLYAIDSPGHLAGHINLLARTADNDGTFSWVYLAGDACHDRRILSKEREIGEFLDAHGHQCCIHADREKAEETIERLRKLEAEGVEIVLAHDVEWENNKQNKSRFFGACQTAL